MNIRPVIGVLAGCGGAGASTFAAVLAGCLAASPRADSDSAVFLIDCDPLAGGIDVLLGCEGVNGPRWDQVRLRGGDLSPALLQSDLPRWGAVSFLAAATAAELDSDAVTQVVRAATLAGDVVIDLPRWPDSVRRAVLPLCDLIVLVAPAEIRAVTSAAHVAAALDPSVSALVVRGTSKALKAASIATALGLEVLGELPYDPASVRPTGLRMSRVRRGTRRVARAAIARTGRSEPADAASQRPTPEDRSALSMAVPTLGGGLR